MRFKNQHFPALVFIDYLGNYFKASLNVAAIEAGSAEITILLIAKILLPPPRTFFNNGKQQPHNK